MTTLAHNRLLAGAVALLLAAVALASAYQQPLWLLAPIGSLLLALWWQQPLWLLYTLLASIPWSVEVVFSNGFGTDLPDEPLMLLTALMAAVLLCFRPQLFRRLHPLLWLLVAQLAWVAIAVALSTYPLFSFKYLLAKTWYLLAFVAAPLLWWKSKTALRHSAAILFGSMLLATTVALVRHGLTGFRFSTVNEALQPFFRNHVNYSALLVFLLPVQVAFWRAAKTKRLRGWLALSFLITLPALYVSYARGAWLAVLVGAIAFVLLKRGWLLKGFALTVLLATAVFVWLGTGDRYLRFAHRHDSTVFHTDFSEHLTATYQGRDVSTAERFHRWVAGVRMAAERWPTGFGPTTFYQQYKSYTVPAFKTWVSKNEEQSTVHNYFLLLLLEQGAPGLLLFLVFLGVLFGSAQRLYHQSADPFWRSAAAVVAIILSMQCTLNFLSDLIETDKVGSVFYLCVAVLVCGDRITRIKDTNKWRLKTED